APARRSALRLDVGSPQERASDALRHARRVERRHVADHDDRERLGGDPQEVAAEAAPASAMTDGRTAVELAMAEAERIIDLPAVVQNATLLHPLHDRGSADHRVLAVVRPPRVVAYRRHDRA